MALFSRRKSSDSDDASAGRPEGVIEPGEQPVTPESPNDSASSDAASAPVPQVTISTSSFRGVGAPTDAATVTDSTPPVAARPSARQPGAMEAPEAAESIPGLRDNALLAIALAEISGAAEPAQLLNVARQLLQGHVFLRVKGDARALLAEGKDLPLAIATRGEEQLVLAYSNGRALTQSVEADGDRDTSAMGQPVMALMQHVLNGPYAGLILDHSSGDARAVLPTALLERMVSEADPELRIKTALSEPRTESTASTIVDAVIAGAPLWIAVSQAEGGPVGVAESRTATGERYLEVFSHPLELLALGR
ncbi:MAG: SseB family protein, partial [Actinomycetota bacterium]|nr:SseB family protein [Actinomycetota bacterium]